VEPHDRFLRSSGLERAMIFILISNPVSSKDVLAYLRHSPRLEAIS
jgi:hypothetical protein